jgi:hypothetical protein
MEISLNYILKGVEIEVKKNSLSLVKVESFAYFMFCLIFMFYVWNLNMILP